MTDWIERTARLSMASHRLVGWIYWDPVAIEKYTALGVPNGMGYYIASRSAPLAPAGPGAVTAAFYSINAVFIEMSLAAASSATTFEAVADARDAAVVEGLRAHVPELIDDLASLVEPLWAVADDLSPSGRVLFAAHRDRARPDDPRLSAWLAVNCIREWRGDTHWAVLLSEGIDGTQAGILHNDFLRYPTNWIPTSRGGSEDVIGEAYHRLSLRGLVDDGQVNAAGRALREHVEQRTNELCAPGWEALGLEHTQTLLDAVEPHAATLLARIDATAGPNWMPAARDRRTDHSTDEDTAVSDSSPG